jgi:hypothetical protein
MEYYIAVSPFYDRWTQIPSYVYNFLIGAINGNFSYITELPLNPLLNYIPIIKAWIAIVA